jgi:hypothetical protein
MHDLIAAGPLLTMRLGCSVAQHSSIMRAKSSPLSREQWRRWGVLWEGLEWEEPDEGWRGREMEILSVSQAPSPPPASQPPDPLYLDGICGECYYGEIEGSMVHYAECPRSYLYHAILIRPSFAIICT